MLGVVVFYYEGMRDLRVRILFYFRSLVRLDFVTFDLSAGSTSAFSSFFLKNQDFASRYCFIDFSLYSISRL